MLLPTAFLEKQIQIKVTKPNINKSSLPQLNSSPHFPQLSYTEPSKLCSFPGFPEKSPTKVRRQATPDSCSKRHLSFSLTCLGTAWWSCFSRTYHCQPKGPLCYHLSSQLKVVVTANKYQEGTSRVKTNQKEFGRLWATRQSNIIINKGQTKPGGWPTRGMFCCKRPGSLSG